MSIIMISAIVAGIAVLILGLNFISVSAITESHFQKYLKIMKEKAPEPNKNGPRFIPRVDLDTDDMKWWWSAWDTQNGKRALSTSGHYRQFKHETDCQDWCNALNRTGFARNNF